MSENERYFFEAIGDGLTLREAFDRRVYETLNYDERGKSIDEICKELQLDDNRSVMISFDKLVCSGYIEPGKTRLIAGYAENESAQWQSTFRKITKEEREEIRKLSKFNMTDLSFIEPLSKGEVWREMQERHVAALRQAGNDPDSEKQLKEIEDSMYGFTEEDMKKRYNL